MQKHKQNNPEPLHLASCRPLPLTLLIFPSGLSCAVFVIWIFSGKYVRYTGMASWYLPFMTTTLAAWAIAMAGLLKMKKWAALLALAALFANQFGHIAIGLWRVDHLIILLGGLPVVWYWEKYV